MFYRIARNFHRSHDEEKGFGRYAPVLEIIDVLTSKEFEGETLVPRIQAVREKMSAKYGRDVLSATTKFLWMKLRSPIIIYDNQARNALRAKGGKIEEYYSLWHKEFDRNEMQITDACDSLQDIYEYTRKPEESTRQYIASIAAQQWFRERVFDVHLWHLGSNGRKTD